MNREIAHAVENRRAPVNLDALLLVRMMAEYGAGPGVYGRMRNDGKGHEPPLDRKWLAAAQMHAFDAECGSRKIRAARDLESGGALPVIGFATRLDLANWLTSAANPLTARVTVNREWQKFFGRGLVETENDFGLQGNFPTHPELLDWLAVEFREGGWSLKKLHKLVVTSATYKQSSAMRNDLTNKDPRNLLLGRQSRLRLEAEIIRDASLSASGLLNPKLGGPGVFPPQPKEVFLFTQSNHPWVESKGPDRYRRGMYTYIWRQSQHPLLTTFDAADAQVVCTKRNRSNTPLQALHMANDPVFVEFANALGTRIEADGPSDDAGRIAFAYRVCFSREPTTSEAARVQTYLDAKRKADPKTAWASVARVLMNLDEFITRE